MTQLQGEPDFNPDGLHKRGHSEYEMMKEDLAERSVASQKWLDAKAYVDII